MKMIIYNMAGLELYQAKTKLIPRVDESIILEDDKYVVVSVSYDYDFDKPEVHLFVREV